MRSTRASQYGWRQKSTALLLSAASDSALRRLATDYAGALRKNADASSLAFTALHARRLDLPFPPAVPLNRETADALSTGLVRNRGAGIQATAPAASRCGCLPAGLALAHYGSNDVPALNGVCRHAGSLFSACSEMLTPSLREAMFNPDSAQLDNMAGRSRRLSRLKSRWRRTGVLKD